MDELEQYIDLLKHHDWSYTYSDDYRLWKKGEAERIVLILLRDKLDPTYALWNKYCEQGFEI